MFCNSCLLAVRVGRRLRTESREPVRKAGESHSLTSLSDVLQLSFLKFFCTPMGFLPVEFLFFCYNQSRASNLIPKVAK